MTEKQDNARRKPGIKHIAEKTGFSPATVSLVLNNKGSFSEETKQTIRQAYAEINHDRAMAEGRPFVRLLMEESAAWSDPYNGDIIRAIELEARALGFEVALTFVRPDASPADWVDDVSGIVLLGGGEITDAMIEELKSYETPLVLVDNYTRRGDVLSVHPDHFGAGYAATEYLLGRGHTKIGFLSGPVKYKPLVDRYAGYCAAMMAAGLPPRPDYVSPNFDRKHIKGYLEMKYVMELEDRPTAVFAVSDRSAYGALHYMRDVGLTPGKDVELIGCDNIRGEQEVASRIATVDVPRAEVGAMAVRFLAEAMKGNTLRGRVVLPGTLILPAL
ncbi:LacI family DNA-binding transcriptional regulator [Paenibacillus sp.]|uniref:LacI family DNA-binding transcriptional regulator n=1 Tax=Paenibacillus sp. TaxID=58172 RepID=UPI002D4DAD6B|nr:LacI family DNA-binding transcriptional regulator [Paenibacillus sp.]HZG56039.1 LacI family DNA-binding transcriptional regulator [Paenibacillus sp.]